MPWRSLIFSPLKLEVFIPEQTLIWLPALTRVCVCACVLLCLFKNTLRGMIFFLLWFIPSCSQYRVSRRHRARVGFSVNEDLSQSGGVYERLPRQRDCLVSWNSQEATAQGEDCWLMKETIFSKATHKLKSFATFRGWILKWDSLTKKKAVLLFL